jgi:hypothetical protein
VHWYCWEGDPSEPGVVFEREDVPAAVFRRLCVDGTTREYGGGRYIFYPTEAEALTDLSRACLEWAKKEAAARVKQCEAGKR